MSFCKSIQLGCHIGPLRKQQILNTTPSVIFMVMRLYQLALISEGSLPCEYNKVDMWGYYGLK